MELGFDSALCSLLCEEDNDLIFDDFDSTNQQKNHQDHIFDYDDEYLIGLPVLNDECFTLMLKRECEHLAARDYLDRLRNGDLDSDARMHAIDWIGKAHAYFNFGPLCLYLSINYLDRFLSIYELPGKAWMMQLLAVACFSIAAKMEETEMPLTLDLQVGESRFLFEGKTIQRMELLVLSTLKWRMQAITPFSFIDYFLRKIYNDGTPPKSSICRSIHLISSLLKGIDFLEFRPSEIAAAVALSIADESFERDDDKEESIYHLLIQHLDKERLFMCVELINGSYLVGTTTKVPSSISPSIPQSPIGVLDAACLSYKCDESTSADSSPSSPKAKRRKLNMPLVLEF
ncbi:cyclin-D4-1-like isoform X2 [Impatiens glandulifera]|uniref:cyclin-D4-1-like isoform X2 n=1 Tax=Impatiens glandulifera TaxID=253017 RepID=UPI001FB0F305|nr:cyclin-D4-1-like isoform X2 [Impatiens glandulifera]